MKKQSKLIEEICKLIAPKKNKKTILIQWFIENNYKIAEDYSGTVLNEDFYL